MIAQSGLGLMLLNGWGVKANPVMALRMFSMAADQGSADGQFHVGQMYYHGIAVEKSFKVMLLFYGIFNTF
jgi:TPR repeat protein